MPALLGPDTLFALARVNVQWPERLTPHSGSRETSVIIERAPPRARGAPGGVSRRSALSTGAA